MERKEMEKLKKSIKGITIISLVITIIVLLILSGVAINLSLGQEGIFKKEKKTSDFNTYSIQWHSKSLFTDLPAIHAKR